MLPTLLKANIFATMLCMCSAFIGCTSNIAKDKIPNTKTGAAPTPTPITTATPIFGPTTIPSLTLSITGPTTTSLTSKSSASVGDAVCTDNIIVTAKSASTAIPNVSVTFSIVTSATVASPGRIEPEVGVTGADGTVSAKYCSGDDAVSVSVVAKAGTVSINSATITIAAQPTYAFRYIGVEDQIEPSAFLAFNNFLEATPVPTETPAPTGTATPAPAAETDSNAILLNLFGAGKDCVILKFEAQKSGKPYSGIASFKSQPDYPIGSKLAIKSAAATTADAVSGRKYLTYNDAESDASGVFKVPVCSGFLPGQLLVSGTFTVDSKVYTARAPSIAINGGIANYGNVSTTYGKDNAKVLIGLFNNNSDEKLDFKVRLQSRLDGVLAMDNPISVISEYGKTSVENDGIPDKTGLSAFSVEPLNLGAYRPVRTTSPAVSNGTNYDYMCTPTDFSTTSSLKFATLAKDWRTTIMYYVKGQEQFFDANHNGQFDATVNDGINTLGSVGFWDKNQNGIFDCSPEGICDSITVWNNYDGSLDTTKVGNIPSSWPSTCTTCAAATKLLVADEQTIYKQDWFVDMSSPFVDANEDGELTYATANTDYSEFVIGESFKVPNGKWDNETYIWKSFLLPIYVGMSPYSLTHRVISGDIYKNFYTDGLAGVSHLEDDLDVTKIGLAQYMRDRGYQASLWNTAATPYDGNKGIQDTLFGCHTRLTGSSSGYDCNPGDITVATGVSGATPTVIAGGMNFWRYAFAQGTCGGPLPGKTKLDITFEDIGTVEVPREFLAHIWMQPTDWILEPSRRLLAESNGSASAVISADPSLHPAKNYSYPVQFQIEVAPCTNVCSGDVVSPGGVYCENTSKWIHLTFADGKLGADTISETITIPSVQTCACMTGAGFDAGVCTCAEGSAANSAGTACVPII